MADSDEHLHEAVRSHFVQDLLGFAAKCAIAAVLFLFVLLFWFAIDVPLLFFGGVIIAVFIRSMSSPLSRLIRLPEPLSVAVVILALCGACWLAGTALAPNVAKQFDIMARQLPDAILNVETQFRKTAIGSELFSRMPSLGDMLANAQVMTKVKGLFTVTVSMLADLFIVFFVALYLTFDPGIYIRGIVRLVPARHEVQAAELFEVMATTLRRWIAGRLASMTAVGLITGVGLWFLGVPLALTLGLLSGILTFIPYLGAVISALPAVLLALLMQPLTALWVVVVYLAAHAVEAYIITPIIQQHQVQMPPVLTLMMQVIMTSIGGLLGLMLATPLTAVVLVLVKILYIENVLGKRTRLPGKKEG